MAIVKDSWLKQALIQLVLPHLNEGASLSDGTVDGEMRVDSPHLVKVALKWKKYYTDIINFVLVSIQTV